MKKTYKARGGVSVVVTLPSGRSHRVSFSGRTGGWSVYYTDNEELQRALEAHPRFGKLFRDATVARPVVVAKPVAEAKPSGVRRVNVASREDARDYLSEKFGIARSKIRTIEAIMSMARSKGIEFTGWGDAVRVE